MLRKKHKQNVYILKSSEDHLDFNQEVGGMGRRLYKKIANNNLIVKTIYF